MSKSFQQINNAINNAANTNTGEVDWETGVKVILQELNVAIKDKGSIYYPTTEALSYAGGTDGGYAVTLVSGVLSPYKWYPEVDVAITDGITSSAGGQWRPIFAINNTPYTDPNIYGTASGVVVAAGPQITVSITQPNTNYIVIVSALNDKSTLNFVKTKLTTSFTIGFDIGASASEAASFDYVLIPQP